MKVYIDIILLINFFFDFLLLFIVNIILKRKIKFLRLIIASLLGSLSVFLLFLNINSFELFLFKVIISILMILIGFGKREFLKSFLYLYFVSILLGGFLYFINLQFSYKSEGLIFFNNGFSINIIVLMIISPLIFVFYYKQSRYFENTLTNVHQVELKFNNKSFTYKAYLDTGNKLYDPYKNRPVHILYNKDLYYKSDSFIMIPFSSLNNTSYVKGIIVDKMIIDNKYIYYNVLFGLSKNKFQLDDADIILHSSLKGEIK